MAPIAGIEPASSPVNGRPRAPCSPDGNKWWRIRESNPGRRSCKDQLQPAAFPVPGRGFEPRSPRFRRGAFTRLAYQARWRGCRSSKPGLMSGAHLLDLQATPAGAFSGKVDAGFPQKMRGSKNLICKNLNWWEADGIEPLARRDRVYSAATAPACPYLHFPIVAFGCRDRSRTDLEQLMRLPGSRTSLQNSARLFISIAYSRYVRGLQNFLCAVLTGGNVRS